MRHLLIATALSCTCGIPVLAQDTLFTIEDGNRSDDPVMQELPIALSLDVLQPGAESEIMMPLPTGDLVIKLLPVSPREIGLDRDEAAWRGTARDGSTVFLMRFEDGLQGQIRSGGRIYRLKSRRGGVGVLEVIDPRRFREAPNDGVEDDRSDVRPPRDEGDSACTDTADRIDIVAFYTDEARDGAGGTQDIENEIAFAIGTTNLAYADSGVFHRLNLVGVFPTGYSEPAGGVDSNALLGNLQSTSDMVLDTIHGTRDAVHADLVTMIYEVDDSSWCGWGNTRQTANADTTDNGAFSVVKRSCAAANLTLAHEVGHNLGALHNRYSTSSSSDHGYNYGHVEMNPSDAGTDPWRTVMSYNAICDDNDIYCDRLGYFSNPNVSFDGDATGTPLNQTDPEHNVMVFSLNDGQVARYRCAQLIDEDPYVWMKDRWEDTGDEPDSATAGKAMWRSPYIWIRLAEDTTSEHEHEHQNPVFGQDAHVYVKAHNDGNASESGDLELYFASASTNLNDPANWTLIDSQATSYDSGVHVRDFLWTNLPGEGHFCLMARWNTDGSALSFSDLDTFVRNSNDVIWRNVNIVGSGGDAGDSENVFLMRGDRELKETFLMIQTGALDPRRIPWAEFMAATLQIDPGIIGADPVIIGAQEVESGLYRLPLHGRTLVVGPVLLSSRDEAKGVLAIEQDEELAKKLAAGLANPAWFDITISQVTEDALQFVNVDETKLFDDPALVLGGVSYQVRLAP